MTLSQKQIKKKQTNLCLSQTLNPKLTQPSSKSLPQLLRGKGLELDTLGLGEAETVDLVFFVRLEVAFPEEGRALLALEGQDVRRHPVKKVDSILGLRV